MASPQSSPPKSPAVPATAITRSGGRSTHHCWSNLPVDILLLIFERLGFADFERAKSVCSPWQSASRQSQPNNQIPWMILFPKDNNYCLLLNPEEKDKVYKTQDLGTDFTRSLCVATYRSWLLMVDDFQHNFYIVDLLTRERINLPSLKSEFGLTSPVFWIDEKTKDYLVIEKLNEETAISLKNGDNSWKQIPELSVIYECFNMVYKDHKLYCLDYNKLHIFDYSGEIPLQVFRIGVRRCVTRRFPIRMRLPGIPRELQIVRWTDNIVVTVRGDVLIVRGIRPSILEKWSFEIYKMDSSKKTKWDKIHSLGDESILLDLGITVLAKDIKGIKRNSIYFNGYCSIYEYDQNDIFIYNLDTKKVEQPQQFVSSSIPCSNARWFLPCFKRK
ncbi:hypothetical protein AALP_AA8G507900 [Arabis alpina]|uniref:F-box domain-containing protein n=1 Tax=Arabis alpina TaxID=50452 RepID=A0A087GET1_ARAAL|nr:hypothetical protein AALP_AA8G507900 [Arabis alpina]